MSQYSVTTLRLILSHLKILHTSNLFPFNNLWSTNICTLSSPCLFCLLNFTFCCCLFICMCAHMSAHGWGCVCVFVSFIPNKPSSLFSNTAIYWVAFFCYYFTKNNQRGLEVLVIYLFQKQGKLKLFSQKNMTMYLDDISVAFLTVYLWGIIF